MAERVPRAHIRVGVEVLRRAVHERLVRHRAARRPVAVEHHRIVDARPLGVEGYRGALRGGKVENVGLVGIDHRAARARSPAGEGIARAREAVGCQRRRHIIGDGLVGHRAARAAVAVEHNGVSNGRPLRIEGHVRGAHRAVGGAVGIGRAGAVGRRVPAGEGIARARELVAIERGGRAVGDALVGHGTRTVVGVEDDVVGIGAPLRDAVGVAGGHGTRYRRVPAGEGVARFGRIGGGRNGCAVILCDWRNRRAACRIKCNGILVDVPLGVQRRAFGRHGVGRAVGIGHRAARARRPAGETVARAPIGVGG